MPILPENQLACPGAPIWPSALRPSTFWLLLAAFILLFLIVTWQIIDYLLANARDEMLYDLHLRAEATAWSIEGAVRFMDSRHGDFNFSLMLAEIGKQPGIAWLALVNSDGRILMDSNPQLSGALLYTSEEIAALQPERQLKGRFSPDDQNIFETWRLFSPQLTHRPHRGHFRNQYNNTILFIALNAVDFFKDLSSYQRQLWFIALLLLAGCSSSFALIFYIFRFRLSRLNFQNIQALACQVIHSYPAALIVSDRQGNLILANKKGAKLLNEKNNLAACQGLDWEKLLAELAKSDSLIEKELTFERPGLAPVPIALTGARLLDSAGAHTGCIFIMRDLAEINLLKRQLAESQRLSALGRLASGLAHEIRNPLSSICGYACYLEQKLAKDSLGAATARLLVEEAQRLNDILEDLLNLARPPKIKLNAEPLEPLLKKIFLIARPDADVKNVTLTLNFNELDVRLATLDAKRITQALLNLILNAIQAVAKGGHVTIIADYLKPDDPDLPGELAFSEGVWRIRVEDDGPGLSGDLREQIFTPYFTTKAGGSGLGLPLARQIVMAHNGMLTVGGQPGKGAIFTVWLPQPGKK